VNWSAWPVWGSLLVFVAIAEVAKVSIIDRLKTRHPYAWTELGSPGYFSKDSFDLVGRLTPYLKSSQDPAAEDVQLRKLVLVRRVSFWLFASSLFIVWISGHVDLLTIYSSHPR
jgi:hypothetical protein